jgi:hypothetical protein
MSKIAPITKNFQPFFMSMSLQAKIKFLLVSTFISRCTCLAYYPHSPEVDFINVNFVEISEAEFLDEMRLVFLLAIFRLEISVYNVYITNQFQVTFAWG